MGLLLLFQAALERTAYTSATAASLGLAAGRKSSLAPFVAGKMRSPHPAAGRANRHVPTSEQRPTGPRRRYRSPEPTNQSSRPPPAGTRLIPSHAAMVQSRPQSRFLINHTKLVAKPAPARPVCADLSHTLGLASSKPDIPMSGNRSTHSKTPMPVSKSKTAISCARSGGVRLPPRRLPLRCPISQPTCSATPPGQGPCCFATSWRTRQASSELQRQQRRRLGAGSAR